MNELQVMLKDLYLVFGLNLSIFDLDGNLVTSYPEKNSPFCELVKSKPEVLKLCHACDKKAFEHVKNAGEIYIYRCHFGLYEACVPLYTYGVLSGFFMMGQTLTDTEYDKNLIKRKAIEFLLDSDVIDEAIDHISFHSQEQIIAFAGVVNIVAEYITLTNRLESKSKNLAEEVHKYLVNNYNQNITIDWLCKYFYVSKSTLINTFKSKYGITVHQFLLEYRLKKSMELLKDKNKTIQDIAIECGFNDANYFSKAFKKKYLLSPTDKKNSL